jgi:hypothetical protein
VGEAMSRFLMGILLFMLFVMPVLFPILFSFDRTGLLLLNARIISGLGSYLYLKLKGLNIR